jgi:hypothetical protein
LRKPALSNVTVLRALAASARGVSCRTTDTDLVSALHIRVSGTTHCRRGGAAASFAYGGPAHDRVRVVGRS